MRSPGVRTAALALLLLPGAEGLAADHQEGPIALLKSQSTSVIEHGLPDVPLERWLHGIAPKRAQIRWFEHDCGEVTGDPEIDAARDLPVCAGVAIDAESRDRMIALSFIREPGSTRFSLHTAALASPSARLPRMFSRLAELAGVLHEPLALTQLACPEGTTPRELREDAGLREWCETPEGRMRGPARSWFRAGVYLMEKGEYDANGRMHGTWLECDRFERCRSIPHGSSAR